jgi:hypothetical protein
VEDTENDLLPRSQLDDISNVVVSSNKTTDTYKKISYEPDKSPVMSPKRKLQQQLYAQHISNNGKTYASPKTIANLAHSNRANTASKATPKSKQGSFSPQRSKSGNQYPDYSPTRTRNATGSTPSRTSTKTSTDVDTTSAAKQLLLAHSLFNARKNEHKEPPLNLNELPKKKYDLSLNLNSIEDDSILKDKNGRDDDSRSKNSLDILWS